MVNIHYFQRKRREGQNFSLEQIFEGVRDQLKNKYQVSKIEVPYVSSGILKRLANVIYCVSKQGTINHVTGDINYVNLLLSKKRNVLTILDCGILHRVNGFKRKVIEKIWFKIPVKRSSTVTVISEATKQDLINVTGCNPEKIRVIYVPISTKFKPVPQNFNKVKPRILQIGAAPNKNLTRLIEAVVDIDCTLSIIGKISDINLRKLEENKVDYENFVGLPFNRVIEEYVKCDLLFFASTFEGFGMPILEAQATARPVLTSNILSMPEVGGNAACYVDPYNTKDIKTSILKIVNDDEYRQTLIQNGLKNIKRFDSSHIARQYAKVYDKIIENLSQ